MKSISEAIAIYLRISQEDIGLKTDSKSESESISNQGNLLTDYIKTNFPSREIIEFCIEITRTLNAENVLTPMMHKINIGTKQPFPTSPDSWVIVDESHDAIITLEEYAKAQNALRKYHELHCTPKSNHPLRGKLVCGVCGHIMPLLTVRKSLEILREAARLLHKYLTAFVLKMGFPLSKIPNALKYIMASGLSMKSPLSLR